MYFTISNSYVSIKSVSIIINLNMGQKKNLFALVKKK